MEPAQLAKGPQAEPVSLPLLVCCVAVALVAVVAYHEDGDKAEGASFVAWGLEERFFLQQEERSRWNLASQIHEIHPPWAQDSDRLCCTEQLGRTHLGIPPSTARQTTFTTLSGGRKVGTSLPTALMAPPAQGGDLRAGHHQLELTALQGDHCMSGHAQGQWEWEQLTLRLCFHLQLPASFSLCLLL